MPDDRMYTIPGGVQREAKKALEWRKKHDRGGTPVGLNTARTLAKGGQIGIRKVRHIAKYFPRHEVDKKGKGWAPGEDNFPSNGRIAWALWGGDAAWRWARAIVERENKKQGRTAGGYDNPEYMDHIYESQDNFYKPDLDSFKMAFELDPNMAPEFMARVRLDDSGIDRLYKIDADGQVYLWDGSGWDNMGHVDGDVYSYDSELDDISDLVEKTHVMIDPESAVIISAFLQERPFQPVKLEEIDPEEAALVAEGLAEEDFRMIDRVITAAGATDEPSGAINPNDNVDTPAERSARAKVQPKDALGRFAEVGSRIVVAGDPARGSGVLESIDYKTNRVKVRLDSGKVISVDPKYTQAENTIDGPMMVPQANVPLDVSGILGEPRTPSNMPKARIPGTLPPLTSKDIQEMMRSWDAWVMNQRKKFVPLKAAATKERTQTPATSDIPAKYLALVSPDDKAAVMDLVAIVPKTATTTEPVVYERKDGEWVANEQILLDLKSSTPPPVVELKTKEILNDVLTQVDKSSLTAASYNFSIFWETVVEPLLAAGGLDRNRGNAEELRRYWTRGAGALKIRWGTPGDWKRCVRYLSKYMGPRAKGYCQLRHKEATGVYTGSKLNPGRDNSNEEFLMEEVWGENIGQPTEVTEKDMLMPIEEIMVEPDDLYDSEWEPDQAICDALDELGRCSDEEFEALIAAGGLDRNRGNAEALRRYWTRGKGALKIRWGTPGDWTRCVRQLSKYMGPRAKGYCQLRHREVTGVYTGSKYNVGKKRGRNNFGTLFASESEFERAIIEKSRLIALAADAREKIGLIASARAPHGARFFIPMLVPEGVESGDGRKFNEGAISVRDLPVPLLWQIKTGSGHDGSVVVGRIDYIERIEGGMGNAYGVFDTGPYGKEAERLVRHGFLRGVSVDLDQFEAKEDKKPKKDMAEDEGEEIGKDKLTINKARIMAATIVAKPAFQECSIELQDEGDQEDILTPEDGVYEESMDDFADLEPVTASGFLKSEVPMIPPADWFKYPEFNKPTPLTVDEDGRVYGHIAAWNVNHIGLPRATKPPRSRSKYAYFHTGVIRTDDGKDVPVGQLTLAGGHAPLNADAKSAAKHYDDTASAVADIHVGEDEYGIWCAGSIRPNLDEMQIRALRASAPSGDWRPINGSLELVAICQVNVPGFPTARAMIASGKVLALVAAGASYMAAMKCSGAACSLSTKAEMLGQLAASAPNLKTRVREAKKALRAANLQALTASAQILRERALTAAAIAELAKISQEERAKLAEEGKALPDGAYPIRNEEDLKNAIQAYGRAKASERRMVRKHIMKRARQLKRWDLIPEHWKNADSLEAAEKVASMREVIVAAAATEFKDYSEETREEYAKKGWALPDGSFPIKDSEDLKDAIQSHGRASDIEAAKKHIVKRAKDLGKETMIPEEWGITASADCGCELKDAVVAAPAAPEEEISEEDLKKLKKAKDEADKQTEEEIEAAEEVKANRGDLPKRDEEGRVKYVSGVNQPRDAKGKYRKVLARLKQNLGVAGLSRALKKVEEAENLDFAGDYAASAAASSELLGMIDRLDANALNPRALENVRLTAAELGKTIANLPLPFGKEAQKVRFSDLPAGLKDLIEQMITRVEAKIGKKDADIATKSLKSYMSGADVYSQGEVQSEMSKLLRLLT